MKRKKQIKAITMIELGFAGVLLVVLALFIYWYADGLSSYTPNAVTYQIIGGENISFSEDATFREKDESINVEDKNGNRAIFNSPVLCENSKNIITPCNMLLMIPKEGTSVKRINRFTTVSEEGGKIEFVSNSKKAESFGGFLYDGEDLYIFLEQTTLVINGDEVSLPALSYAIVDYCQYIEYYNSETKEDEVIYMDSMDITAKASTGYKLDIGRDIIFRNKQESLLFKNVNSVKVIEMD